MNLEIANRLVALRKENRLSQEALAEKLGISRQAVSKWERAEASPDTDNLIALAKLYHVSLDELLRIHEEDESGSADGGEDKAPEGGREAGNAAAGQMAIRAESIESESSGDQTKYEYHNEAGNETSGRTGESGEDEVHIGLHGIHIKEHGGDEVHVGWDGIHVHDKNNEVHIDKHGIYVDGEEVKGHLFGRGGNTEFPLWLLAFVIHIAVGTCFGLWWTGWLIYCAVPVIGTFIRAVRCRNPYLFAYPVLAVFIFLYMGLVYSVWHPTWVVFLTIPLYYSFLGYMRGRRDGGDSKENEG